MPDFFLDRFVRINSVDELASMMKRKSRVSGGGSIRGIEQFETKGGNAVNLGYALARFGSKVSVITIADSTSEKLLRGLFHEYPSADVQVVRGKPGFTVAFEFKEGDRNVNVMVSDIGGVLEFGPEMLGTGQWKEISKSSVVCVVNWSANKKSNELCEAVFSSARRAKAKTFFDPADLAGETDRLAEFKRKVLDRNLVDVISLNENEARIIGKTLCNYSLPAHCSQAELKKAVALLANRLGTTVDLHTKQISFSSSEGSVTSVRCHKVDQRIVTGAGDVWDAADLVGYQCRISAEDRLALANAAAGLYVSRDTAECPSMQEVLAFLEAEDSATVVR
jgi:ribokinase